MTTGVHAGHAATLRDYLHVVWRRKWIILPALVLVPLAAVLFSLHQPKRYTASAQVLLSSQNLAAQVTGTQAPVSSPDRVAQTQADVARVPELAERVLKEVPEAHLTSGGLLGASSVATSPNADILTFEVSNADPVLARKLVNAYVSEYTNYRRELDTSSIKSARVSIEKRIKELAADKASPLYATLVEREQQLATMEALQTSNASVLKRAQDAAQVATTPTRNGIFGAALGLMLGIGLALLWEALDTRVRRAEEIATRLNLPLLARLPAPPRRLRSKEELVMIADPRSADAEAFRMLRTNLEFTRLGKDVRTLMVTSAVEREGKSTTVANLAVAIARSGQRVALVDLDLRRPFLDHFFDVRYRPGLTQVAIGRARLDDALIPVAIGERDDGSELRVRRNGGQSTAAPKPRGLPSLQGGSLHILLAGLVPPNVGEFVGSDALADILRELRSRFDTVLIDSPPALQVGDPMALSPHVDGIVVVTRMHVVRRPMLVELRRLLDTSPAQVLGFVITDAESAEYGYAGAGYYSASARDPVESRR